MVSIFISASVKVLFQPRESRDREARGEQREREHLTNSIINSKVEHVNLKRLEVQIETFDPFQ